MCNSYSTVTGYVVAFLSRDVISVSRGGGNGLQERTELSQCLLKIHIIVSRTKSLIYTILALQVQADTVHDWPKTGSIFVCNLVTFYVILYRSCKLLKVVWCF